VYYVCDDWEVSGKYYGQCQLTFADKKKKLTTQQSGVSVIVPSGMKDIKGSEGYGMDRSRQLVLREIELVSNWLVASGAYSKLLY